MGLRVQELCIFADCFVKKSACIGPTTLCLVINIGIPHRLLHTPEPLRRILKPPPPHAYLYTQGQQARVCVEDELVLSVRFALTLLEITAELCDDVQETIHRILGHWEQYDAEAASLFTKLRGKCFSLQRSKLLDAIVISFVAYGKSIFWFFGDNFSLDQCSSFISHLALQCAKKRFIINGFLRGRSNLCFGFFVA